MAKLWPNVSGFFRTSHTYLTMFALLGMSFFAVTGLMLNHSAWFGIDKLQERTVTGSLPLKAVQPVDKLAVVEALRSHFGAAGRVDTFESDDQQLLVTFSQPGKRSQAAVNTEDGTVMVTHETHGVAGILADLHKGASAGGGWKMLIDATAVSLILALLTGLVVWLSVKKRRVLGIAVLTAGCCLWAGAYFLLAIR